MIVSKTAPIKLDITCKMKPKIWEVKLTSVFVGLFICGTVFFYIQLPFVLDYLKSFFCQPKLLLKKPRLILRYKSLNGDDLD